MNRIFMKTSGGHIITADRPTEEDILNLKVGDVAPYVFGQSIVTEIFGRGYDVNGKAFVCYYVQYGQNAQMSHSLKAGEVDRTIFVCHAFKSAEIDRYDEK